MIGDLPKALTVHGREYGINTDYRDVLTILEAFDDPNLQDDEKAGICLMILYEDYRQIPPEDYTEAYEKAVKFIDYGQSPKKGQGRKLMDWEQDETIIFPAINKVAGREVREAEYIHWWTFLGYYMEIADGIFSRVVSIRAKKQKGKKLEKWETEFYQANMDLINIKPKLSDEEKERRDRIKKLLDGV